MAHRLRGAGYRVVVLEVGCPTVVRRAVAFAEAVVEGAVTVEGVEARMVSLDGLLAEAVWPRWIPVIVDPDGDSVAALGADAVVDARMAKVNLGTTRNEARVTLGLGPGFVAGLDVDYVVETARGHTLGRLISEGPAEPDTGIPGLVCGVGSERVIRAPAEGCFEAVMSIGDLVVKGDVVGHVAGTEVRANTSGLLRGLVADGVRLREGQKTGDVDPRGAAVDHRLISDKARSVGGAVLEGLLRGGVLPSRRPEEA